MAYGLKIATAPTVEPVSLDEAKLHLRLTANDFDAEISRLITAARQSVEAATHRALLTQTWDLYLDEWPAGATPIYLPLGQLQSVSSVAYTDSDGAPQTWASTNYSVQTLREPGTVALGYQKTWPSIRYIPDAVRVRFVCGWTAAASVPATLRQACLLLIGHWFNAKEAVNIGNITSDLPHGVEHLCRQFVLGDEWCDYARAG